MPTAAVILPTTTYRAADFIRAAEGLGVDVVVVSDEAPPMDMGDRFLEVDCAHPEIAARTLVEFADRVPIDAVVAVDDGGVETAALAATQLGLHTNTPEAARSTRNKWSQRRLLAQAEVPQPEFRLIPPGSGVEALAGLSYPIVLKPLDRAAGQGVIRADHAQEAQQAVVTIRGIVGEDAPLIGEEFVAGVEVAVEGIMAHGLLTPLAVFDKPEASRGPYFEETILVTPSLLHERVQSECLRVAQSATTAIGIAHGPVHIELIVEGPRVSVVEVAARSIGGLCSRSLNFGLMGTSLEALILRNALGWDKHELTRERVASGVLMIPVPGAGVFIGVRNADAVKGVAHVTGIDLAVAPGTWIEPPPVGDRYLGFVFARAESPDVVTRVLTRVREEIEVEIG